MNYTLTQKQQIIAALYCEKHIAADAQLLLTIRPGDAYNRQAAHVNRYNAQQVGKTIILKLLELCTVADIMGNRGESKTAITDLYATIGLDSGEIDNLPIVEAETAPRATEKSHTAPNNSEQATRAPQKKSARKTKNGH